jgi:hypothetical protein
MNVNAAPTATLLSANSEASVFEEDCCAVFCFL